MTEFFKLMLSGDSGVSSKRFTGLICFLIYILIFISTYFHPLTPAQIAMADMFVYAGSGLLGATLFEKFAIKK